MYVLSKMGKVEGMKKLYKLLYYIDFDNFELREKPITGDIYKKLPMGPVPTYFNAIIANMDSVSIKKEKKFSHHQNDTTIYTLKGKVSDDAFDVLDKKEIKMIDRVIKKYGQYTGAVLENLTHKEAPYNAVGPNEVIPYEYAYYRDTQDLNE